MRISATVSIVFIFFLTQSLHASEMTFKLSGNGGNCIGCEWISAEGIIVEDSDKKLVAIMSEGNYNTVVLNSPGGNLAAALRMGRAIRNAGYSTSVGKTIKTHGTNWKEITGGICASACAFAFIGGKDRYADSGKIGVHQFYTDAAIERPEDMIFTALDLSTNQYIEALLMEYAIEMNVDYRFVLKAAATSPASMYYFNTQELTAWRIVFNSDGFQPWEIETWKEGVIAFSRSNNEKTTATFFCTKENNNKLMISVKESRFQGPFEPVKDYSVSYLYALGLRIPSSQAKMSENGGVYRLIIDLGQFDINTLDKNKFAVSSDAPNATRPYFSFGLTSNKALENIKIAMKNCI